MHFGPFASISASDHSPAVAPAPPLDADALRRITEDHVERLLSPLTRRLDCLEEKVAQLSEHLERSSPRVQRARVATATPIVEPPAQGLAALTEESAGLVFGYLPLRAPFVVLGCSCGCRQNLRHCGSLLLPRMAEFACAAAPDSNAFGPVAKSLHEWASLRLAATSSSRRSAGGARVDVNDADCDSIASDSDDALDDPMSCEPGTASEVHLDGRFALAFAQRNLSAARFNGGAFTAEALAALLRDTARAEFRSCRCRAVRHASPQSSGHTNTYVAEAVIPLAVAGRTSFRIEVKSFRDDGEDGWDAGFDVACQVDGRQLFQYHLDGSDPAYDAKSLNTGVLQYAVARLLGPAGDEAAALHVLWRFLCAPALAWGCSPPHLRGRVEEDPQGFSFGHRLAGDSLTCTGPVFLLLGKVFTELAARFAGHDPASGPVSESPLDDEAALARLAAYMNGS